MMQFHPRTSSGRGFTLVELLVCIAVLAVLIAFFLPSLERARRHALRIQCASNLRQMGLGTLTYAQDFAGNFPRSGGGYSVWAYLNMINDGQYLCENYTGKNASIFHCPVNRPKYFDPTWPQATKTNSFAFGEIGYLYMCGEGQDINDPQRSHGVYNGWDAEICAYAEVGGAPINSGPRRTLSTLIMPTFSLKEAERYQNVVQRPMFMDLCMFSVIGGNASLRRYPGPAHADARGNYTDPYDINLVYVDGHQENIADPRHKRPYRGSGQYLYF